jgi:vomeronasal1 receptor
VKGPENSKNVSSPNIYKYCLRPTIERLTHLLLASILFLIDYIFMGFTAWASGSMVLVLHRHSSKSKFIATASPPDLTMRIEPLAPFSSW